MGRVRAVALLPSHLHTEEGLGFVVSLDIITLNAVWHVFRFYSTFV